MKSILGIASAIAISLSLSPTAASATEVIQTGSFTNLGVGRIHKYDPSLGPLRTMRIVQTLGGGASGQYSQVLPGSGTSVIRVNLVGQVGTEFGGIVIDHTETQDFMAPFVSASYERTIETIYNSATTDLSRFVGTGDYIFTMFGTPLGLYVSTISGPEVYGCPSSEYSAQLAA